MTDINKHPILREIATVVSAIESCGASPQITQAAILASSLFDSANALIEAQSARTGAGLARGLTPADIEATIVSRRFHRLQDTQITICELTLRNGAKVLGRNYGSVDPAKQNWEQGEAAALKHALDQVWELEGYLLRERLHAAR